LSSVVDEQEAEFGRAEGWGFQAMMGIKIGNQNIVHQQLSRLPTELK
jgi:hypothetical protein